MKKFGLIFIIAAALVLASCSSPITVQQLIPQESIAVFQVEQPKNYLNDLDLFIKPLGVTGGKSLFDLIKENETLAGFHWDSLDLDQPWVAALLKGQDNKPGVMLLIPLKDPSKNYPLLKDALEKRNGQKSLLQGSYAVIYSGLEHEPVYPLQKTFDMSKLKVKEKSGLTCYVDIAALQLAILPAGTTLDALLTTLLSQNGALSFEQKTTYEALAHGLAKVLSELLGVQINLVTDPKGLGVWARTEWKEGGEVQALFKGLNEVKGSREFYKYLDSASLISGVVNLPAGKSKELSEKLTKATFGAWNVKEDVSAAYFQQLNALLDLQGSRTAFNFNVDYDVQQLLLAFLMGMPSSEQLKNALKIDCSGVIELRDAAAYQNAFKSYWASPAVSKMSEAVLHESGLPVRIKALYSEQPADKGVNYATLVFRAEISPEASATQRSALAKTVLMFNVFFDQIKGYYSFKDQKAYFAFGSDGLSKVKALVEKDSVAQNWTNAETLKPWSDLLPDDAMLTANLSLSRLSLLVKKSAMPGTELVPELPPSLGLIFFARSLSQSRVEGALFWGENEIQLITNHLINNLPRLMGQGQLSGAAN